VFTTGLTGCTSISGRSALLRAVGLGFGSGRNNGSSADLCGCLVTRRGRLDWAAAVPRSKSERKLNQSVRRKYRLSIKGIRGVVLKSQTGKPTDLVSDALSCFLVCPVPVKRLLTKAPKEKVGQAFLP